MTFVLIPGVLAKLFIEEGDSGKAVEMMALGYSKDVKFINIGQPGRLVLNLA